MPTYRCQHSFNGWAGTSKDSYTNTFYLFGAVPTDPLVFPGLAECIRRFYKEPGTGGVRILDWMSPRIQGMDESVRIYDMTTAPGPPVFEETTMMGSDPDPGDDDSIPDVQGLPEEVAVCLSYNALGENVGRRRGRIYIGPLSVAAIEEVGNTYDPVEINGAFITAILGSAAAFAGLVNALGYKWRVFSKMDGFGFDIVNTSVDNAFDTIRGRGRAPSSRASNAISQS